MVELDRILPGPAAVVFGEHGDAGVPAAGVDADCDALDGGVDAGAVLQPDDERGVPDHRRPAGCQQAAGTGRMARIERVAVGVQDEHGHMALTGRSLRRRDALGVTPAQVGAARTGLPSPMFHAGARRCR
ncbi:hypothetical protein GCM10009525_11090 [Streptosporangium amethystogenes subsp. fukuiense]